MSVFFFLKSGLKNMSMVHEMLKNEWLVKRFQEVVPTDIIDDPNMECGE